MNSYIILCLCLIAVYVPISESAILVEAKSEHNALVRFRIYLFLLSSYGDDIPTKSYKSMESKSPCRPQAPEPVSHYAEETFSIVAAIYSSKFTYCDWITHLDNDDEGHRICMVIHLIVVEDSKAWSGWHWDNPITRNTSTANYFIRQPKHVKKNYCVEWFNAMGPGVDPVGLSTPKDRL